MNKLVIYDHCATMKVNILELPSDIYDKINEDIRLDADTDCIEMTLEDMQKYQIPNEAVAFNSCILQTDLLEDLIIEQIGNHPYYLVYIDGYFKISNITDIVNTITQHNLLRRALTAYILNTLDNRGFSYFGLAYPKTTYIVGLTPEEYNQYVNAELSDIEQFVNTIFKQ